ncbi:hypothetical protein Plano_0816 [Planococcus sp. PAMC 21323]|nr:hypothetical protein Plano_0816 [Planococcus sp. PAMC 21323]
MKASFIDTIMLKIKHDVNDGKKHYIEEFDLTVSLFNE